MRIPLHEVRQHTQHYAGTEPGQILELAHDIFVHADGPLQYDLTAERLGHELLVRGTLRAPLRCLCARCGAWYAWVARENHFTRTYPLNTNSEAIDLTNDLREAILLVLPAYGVCRPTCKGLCAHCGADLNRAPCTCHGHALHPAWNALGELTLK